MPTVRTLRDLIVEMRLVVEAHPYARAYASHMSGDPQQDHIDPEVDEEKYESLVAVLPEFLRKQGDMRNPDKEGEVHSNGTEATLTGRVDLAKLPELHLPKDSYFGIVITVTTVGEAEADPDGYSWSQGTTGSYTLEGNAQEDDAFFEDDGYVDDLVKSLKKALPKFLAVARAQVPPEHQKQFDRLMK